ncbi:10739_t:CDS:2 [Paraglomus occultum]|uniref:10739_t:CDS:1 n=1 Tax=Paraglomus occultum TaxID=144539 RepID=A0A9N8VPR3_9GLOM|nr:10739_t:CDS:2 [Paraglomus occultum]
MSPKETSPVSTLQPDQCQLNLCVKVITQIMLGEVSDNASWVKVKVAEFLVGDASGCVILKAIDEQISLLVPQTTVLLQNARIEMYRGFMRLIVDNNANGAIIPVDEGPESVNTDKNVSLVEYQYVPGICV